jgi:hypothetical protein
VKELTMEQKKIISDVIGQMTYYGMMNFLSKAYDVDKEELENKQRELVMAYCQLSREVEKGANA